MSHGHELAGALLMLGVCFIRFLAAARDDKSKVEKSKKKDRWGGWKWH